MRITTSLLKVLTVLLDAGEPVYGMEVLRSTGLKSGTLYPLLDRLEKAGWVTSYWEAVNPRQAGRPRRRFYRLTGLGCHEARQAMLAQGFGGGLWAR